MPPALRMDATVADATPLLPPLCGFPAPRPAASSKKARVERAPPEAAFPLAVQALSTGLTQRDRIASATPRVPRHDSPLPPPLLLLARRFSRIALLPPSTMRQQPEAGISLQANTSSVPCAALRPGLGRARPGEPTLAHARMRRSLRAPSRITAGPSSPTGADIDTARARRAVGSTSRSA